MNIVVGNNQIQEELKLDNLRVRVRHKSGDITKRPAVAIKTELTDINENIFNVYSIHVTYFSRKFYIPFQMSNEIILGFDIQNSGKR